MFPATAQAPAAPIPGVPRKSLSLKSHPRSLLSPVHSLLLSILAASVAHALCSMMNRDPLSSSQAPLSCPHAAHSELAVSTNGCPHPRPSLSPDTAHVQNPRHSRHQQGGTTSSLQGPDTVQQPQQGTSGHPRFLALPPLLPVADTMASPPLSAYPLHFSLSPSQRRRPPR